MPPGKHPIITYKELTDVAQHLSDEYFFQGLINYLHAESCVMFGPDAGR